MPPVLRSTCAAILLLLALPAHAAVVVVDSLLDAGDGNCTLREAIQAANLDTAVDGCAAGAGTDLIDLTQRSGTLQLGPGLILITSDLTVDGPGARVLKIRGTTNQTFGVEPNAAVTFRDVTIGDATEDFATGVCFQLCDADLVLERVRITNCDGVGIAPGNSVLGGAIGSACESTHLTILDSLIDGNDVATMISGAGGVFLSGGTLVLENTTFSANTTAGAGGALRLEFGATAALENVTFSGNAASTGFGAALLINQGGTAELHDTVFAAGATGANCTIVDGNGLIVSQDYNVSDDASCALDEPNDQVVDPVLLPLADNGGPTDTHLPGQGSPLVDGGDPAGCTRSDGITPLLADQRGSKRPFGEECDIGAVEVLCPSVAPVCRAASKGTLSLSARPGKEKLEVRLSRFAQAILQTDFGNPVGDDTAYAACFYASDDRIGEVLVDRAGDFCGNKPCWKPIGPPPPSPKGKGYAYKDAALAAGGVLKLSVQGGGVGKGKASLSLRGADLGAVFDALTGNSVAGVAILPSEGECVSVRMEDVTKDDGVARRFKAVLK